MILLSRKGFTKLIINQRTKTLDCSKVKTDRIHALRKQYDAFLEDDKKRKQRNEYILGSLDKMRSCATVDQIRHRHVDGGRITALNRVRFLPPANEPTSCNAEIPMFDRSRMAVSPKYNDDTTILNELSKKFILIPKLNTNYSFVGDAPSNKTNIYNNNELEWKSKYKILEKLKQDEKEQNSSNKEILLQEKDLSLISGKMHGDLISEYGSNTVPRTTIVNQNNTPKVGTNTDNRSTLRDSEGHMLQDSSEKNVNSIGQRIMPGQDQDNLNVSKNNKTMLNKDDIGPPTTYTYEYEYKNESRDKELTKEDVSKYGPYGPQTEPYTYEYSYKKDTESEDNDDIKNSVADDTQNIVETSNLETQPLEVVKGTENLPDNTLNDLREQDDQGLKEDLLETSTAHQNLKETKPNVEVSKLSSQSDELVLGVNSKDNYKDVNSSYDQNLTENDNLVSGYGNNNPQNETVHHLDDANDNNQAIEYNNEQASDQLEYPSNPVYDNEDPLVTQYEPNLVYDPTQTSYEHDETGNFHEQQTFPSEIKPHSAEPCDQLNLQSYNPDQGSYETVQNYDASQLPLDQSTHLQQYDNYDSSNLVPQDISTVEHLNLKNDQFDVTHEDYDSNAQGFDANEVEYDKSQLEYNPDQTEYDPSQQGYDASQQEYNENQDGFGVNQQEFDTSQLTQQEYDTNHQQYNTNQGAYDVNQQEYLGDELAYDPNQHAYDTNQGYENDQQHYAGSEQQYDEQTGQYGQQHEPNLQQNEFQYDTLQQEQVMNQQLDDADILDEKLDANQTVATNEIQSQPLQMQSENIKPIEPKLGKEKKETDNKNTIRRAKDRNKEQSAEQAKAVRKVRA